MADRNYPYESNIFGIGEGKRKKVVEEEKRKTAELEAQLKLKTAGVDAAATQAIFDLENMKAIEGNKMYIILGIVLVLVVGLAMYFKFRKK